MVFSIVEIYQLTLDLFRENDEFRVITRFIPGLLSLSYPLIVQTVSRLNDQYKSTHIVYQFKKEKLNRYFRSLLIVSITLSIFSFFSPDILIFPLFLSVILLMIVFFLNIELLLTYLDPKRLFLHYNKRISIKKHVNGEFNYYKTSKVYYLMISFLWYSMRYNKSRLQSYISNNLVDESTGIKDFKKKILLIWHPIIDLYKHSIEKRDIELSQDIEKLFLYNVFNFIQIAEHQNKERLEYPIQVENSITEIIATYIKNYDDVVNQDFSEFVGKIYFPSGIGETKFLSQQTYIAIWKNLVLLIENNTEDIVMRYWGWSHQYFGLYYNFQQAEYDSNFKETLESIANREKITFHRKYFLQLHFALGAYLMYKHKYKTLKEIWFHTQSQPPKYDLMPRSVNEVLGYFFGFLSHNPFEIDTIIGFWFKGLSYDKMNNKKDVKTVFRQYAALLFLRQWYNDEYYINHLSYPQIPSSQTEKRKWQGNLNYFKNLVKKHLDNIELLEALGMDFSTEKLDETKQLHPLDYIDEIKSRVEKDFKATIELSELDTEKIERIDKETIYAIRRVYESVIRINGNPVSEADRDEMSNTYQTIRGEGIFLDRESLIKEPSISHIGFDSILGQYIRTSYLQHIYLKFSENFTKNYQVPHSKIFEGIDMLKLKGDAHVIITFNVNFSFYRDYNKVQLTDGTDGVDFFYKSIPIYSFEASGISVSPNIFILRKSDLPMVKHIDWTEVNNLSEETRAYWKGMECVDTELKIYRKITDFNNEDDAKNIQMSQGYKEEDLKNKIDIRADFLGYFWFKKGIEIISISENYMFQEGGIENTLDDIQPFA